MAHFWIISGKKQWTCYWQFVTFFSHLRSSISKFHWIILQLLNDLTFIELSYSVIEIWGKVIKYQWGCPMDIVHFFCLKLIRNDTKYVRYHLSIAYTGQNRSKLNFMIPDVFSLDVRKYMTFDLVNIWKVVQMKYRKR